MPKPSSQNTPKPAVAVRKPQPVAPKRPKVADAAPPVATGTKKPPRVFTTESRAEIMAAVCELLKEGHSLPQAIRLSGCDVRPPTILDWANRYPELRDCYARARDCGYAALADEIMEISDEASVAARYNEDEVTLVLDATAVARNRLRVDTRKWLLSKMLPKQFGDKVTQALTGPDGGPIQAVNMELRNLAPDELVQLEALLKKANAA